MKRRSLYKCTHPIDALPFEAFYDGSWWTVKSLRIKEGTVNMHFEPNDFDTKEKVPIVNLRMSSRKASISDCICFLRPGVDICIFSTYSSEDGSGEASARFDAKINSIERKPHESGCSCRFYVNFYTNHHPFVMEQSTLDKEIKEVAIDDIAILQQLDRKPCEDGYYRWSSSKDCPFKSRVKLFRGQFSYDVSWLLVASTLKGFSFDIISTHKKMVYRIFDSDQDKCSSGSVRTVNAINFQADDGVMRPNIRTFVPEAPVLTSVPGNTIKEDPLDELHENGLCNSSLYEIMDLRRSKRRNVQPDRFVGYDVRPVKEKSCVVRMEANRVKRLKKEAETPPGMSHLADDCVEQRNQGEKTVNNSRYDLDRYFSAIQIKIESNEERFKSSASNCTTLTPVSVSPLSTTKYPVLCPQFHPSDQILLNQLEKIGKISSKCGIRRVQAIQMKNKSGRKQRNLESRLEEKESHKDLGRKRASFCLKRRKYYDASTYYKRKILSSSEYKKVIERCMKNINSEIAEHQSHPVSQWKSVHAIIPSNRWRDVCTELPASDDVKVENEELDCLWKEMEISTNALQCLDESQSNIVEFSNEVVEKSSESDELPCQHEYQLDEEIGVICQLCRSVITEIRYVSPPFLQSIGWVRDKDQCNVTNELGCTLTGDMDLDIFRTPDSPRNISLEEENENVWALIPDLKNRLHIHQKKAFEFLWRNIAGSLIPADMEATCKRTGGCVISHSPGAGKTLLVIAFLVSFLRLFPKKRPLILAPNTTLYTWGKEIKKWEVPIPLYQIHSRRNFKKELQSQEVGESTGDRKPNQDVMHAIDCLEKLRKWHEQPSVLLMSYPCFFSLMREKSKLEYWRYMARVLRQSPGILILDEGHNPRSTKSKLRKILMEVKTELRVLLSGTLFQNSFEEYFNTLCLARPNFISEVLKELDPLYGQRSRRKSTNTSKQNLARKFFVDKIAKRINSQVEKERRRGLNKLKKMTNGFIDAYEGGVSDRLPGLQAYALLIKPTVTQEKALSKLQKYSYLDKRYSLEVELLITLVSIHPWLIKTSECVDKYFSPGDLEELERHRLDVKKGSKVTFVVNLVSRCIIKNEKVLIFCRNIAPMKLFLEIFERIFGWKEGDQVLMLHGEQLLFERSRVIDKFEEPGGVSQVLLASIGACGEGISLTAASRVVLLDSEWNPSKIKQAVGRAFRPGQEKVVYVYQLLTSGTVEEKKHNMTAWKDWVSRMIFVGTGVEDSSCTKADNIDDDVLREIVEEDENKSFHMIMKDEKLSIATVRGKELMQYFHSSSL
ncbi:SNF2-related [Macleaya cordata]|uniref:SNF2-related n=1 Tax=Macleaya cordata TaxID=56857 RepID=A0A200PXB9_MACCD|nr:SNF2-related [Macleaya cordata]